MLHVFTPCNIYGVESVSYLKYKTVKSNAVLETVVKDISLYSFNSVTVHYTNTSAKITALIVIKSMPAIRFLIQNSYHSYASPLHTNQSRKVA